ncbi:MAG: hypothetical protein ACXWE6_11315 [Nitrososphaeraceae archaeon]
MHKSIVFTFGLLASSLVMLGVMPFLNQQDSFLSNTAMAQEYDGNYYGDSSYSTYPTDDKKYECRTGPFEGFFVGSVEFCKFKFDDKDRKDIRDNDRTGTQGPHGPQGPQGPAGSTGTAGPQGIQGPIGLQGPNQINSSSVYTVGGNFSNTQDDGRANSVAMCNLGDTVLSGSYAINNPTNAFSVNDFALATQDGWVTLVTGGSAVPGLVAVTTSAQCFNNP